MAVDFGVGLYECSGLTVAAEIPLAAPRSAVADPAEADVTVVLGSEVDQPFERPSADLVAELVMGNFLCYSICRVGDGYVARLPWIADFHIDADLRLRLLEGLDAIDLSLRRLTGLNAFYERDRRERPWVYL